MSLELIAKKQKELAKIESQLDKNRACTLVDGWQTQRYARKARKWDYLAQEKMKLIGEIEDLENEYNEAMKNAYYCIPCGAIESFDCICDET